MTINEFAVETLSSLDALPEERKKSLLEEVQRAIVLGVRAVVVENMPADRKDDLERLVETGGDEELLAFGRENICDFEEKLKGVYNEVAEALVEQVLLETHHD